MLNHPLHCQCLSMRCVVEQVSGCNGQGYIRISVDELHQHFGMELRENLCCHLFDNCQRVGTEENPSNGYYMECEQNASCMKQL